MASSNNHQGNTPIFLDSSKRRKWYFRTGTIMCFSFMLLATSLFLFGLTRMVAHQQSVTYQNAIERYHYYYSGANSKKVALTFDDGPNPPASEDIMNALSSSNAPATFFFIGKRALIRPDVVQEAEQKGFDVEDHSFTHAQGVQGTYSREALELDTTSFILSQITGHQPLYYRPPFLLDIGVDPTINPYIPIPQNEEWMLQLGYLPVGSDIDTKDWLATKPSQVVDGLASALQASPNGHIILLHDDPNTAKSIPAVVSYLRTQGYSIVPLSTLLTPPSVISLSHALAFGDTDATTGGEVSELQWFLYQQKYLDPYALSGAFDAQTQSALINFQSNNHVFDASNPNPEVVGIAGPATRALIHGITVSQAPLNLAVPHTKLWNYTIYPLQQFVLAVYINLFPFIRGVLEFMVTVTLLLVIMRSLGLLSLLLYRWIKGEPKKTESTNHPGVSVLIPAYNEKENIASTVESVIACNYRPREIIVIDDGSTDTTADEVRGVMARYPSELVRLISIENGGKANALNVGVEESTNEIVIVLDADAILERSAIDHMVPHFADPMMSAVAGKVCTTGALSFLDVFQKLEYAIGQNIDKTAFSTIGAVGVVPGPAGAWRRSFLLEAGGFHTDTLVEDQEMTLSMLHMGKKVAYEPRAIAYTETPHTVENFLKQRFRWVYGTMQCFWKHKSIMVERPDSVMSLIVMPNIFVYNILLPLTYPFADSALLFGLIFGEWQTLVLPFLFFTFVDLLYAVWGLRGEPQKWKLILAVPLQRVVYRQLLYYTVYKAFIRATEGTGSRWNKFAKIGDTKRFFMALGLPVGSEISPVEGVVPAMGGPQLPQLIGEEVIMSLQGPEDTSFASTNLHEVMSLSDMPRQSHIAGDTSSPAFSPNVFMGAVDEPNTYAKSSSPFGPTSSH